MKSLIKRFRICWLSFLIALAGISCSDEMDEVVLNEEKKWSSQAPHQPNSIDIEEKISANRIEGGIMPNVVTEDITFNSFEEDSLILLTSQALIENKVSISRIDSLLELYNDPSFQQKVNMEPNTGRLLITTVSHTNEVVRRVSEATFNLLSENLNRLIITDDFPVNASGASSFTQQDLTIYTRESLFKGSKGEDLRGELFNEATEISYLLSEITPPSQNAQILVLVLQSLYIMHDYEAFLDEQNSGSIANIGIRDNLASLFLTLYRPRADQEALLNGRYLKHPDAIFPQDNPNTVDFDESALNTMYELIESFRSTVYSNAPKLPSQTVPQWLADQYEVLTGSVMPNGNYADIEAIEIAIQACNNFLDNRSSTREFIINYYGVEF